MSQRRDTRQVQEHPATSESRGGAQMEGKFQQAPASASQIQGQTTNRGVDPTQDQFATSSEEPARGQPDSGSGPKLVPQLGDSPQIQDQAMHQSIRDRSSRPIFSPGAGSKFSKEVSDSSPNKAAIVDFQTSRIPTKEAPPLGNSQEQMLSPNPE